MWWAINWTHILRVTEAKFLIVREVKNMEKENILEFLVLVSAHGFFVET